MKRNRLYGVHSNVVVKLSDTGFRRFQRAWSLKGVLGMGIVYTNGGITGCLWSIQGVTRNPMNSRNLYVREFDISFYHQSSNTPIEKSINHFFFLDLAFRPFGYRITAFIIVLHLTSS